MVHPDVITPEEEKALVDLVSLAEPALLKAIRSGHFMVAVVSLNGAELEYWVRRNDFFQEDVGPAIELIRQGTQATPLS